jgi:hypothetical protein
MKRLYSFVLLAGLLAVSFTQTASALDPLAKACGSPGAGASSVCQPTSAENPVTGPNGVLIRATHIVAFAAGAAAVILIIISGIRLITSQGEAAGATAARKTLMNAVIGLVVIIFAQAIITFVIGKIFT